MFARSLKNRFRLVISCMIALFVSIAVIVATGIWHTNGHFQESVSMDALVVNLYELRTLNKEYLATPSKRIKQQWLMIYAQANKRLAEQPNIPDDVKDAVGDLQQLFERLMSMTDASSDMDTSQKRLKNQLATNLNLESQRVIDWAAGISRNTKESIVLHLMLIGAFTLAAILVATLVVIAIMFFTTSHILSSVNRLKEGAEEIAGGRLGFQVEQAGNDEIATLAAAVNQMSQCLLDSYDNLRERTVLLEKEIEERKRTEGLLRESEEKYRTIIEDMDDGYHEVDLRGNFTFLNEPVCKMLGYSREVLLGMNNRQYADEENVRKVYQAYNQVFRTGEPIKNFEWQVIRKDGACRNVEVSISIIQDGKGRPTGFRGIARDISDRRRAEEEKRRLEERLRRSEKMEALGQLAGGVAHDLNNVLGILSGYSELLLEETPEGSPSRIYVDKILQSTKKGAAIIQDLLTLARRGVMVSDVINLNTIVSDFLETPVFDKFKDYHPHVTFRTESDESLLNIKGSPVHLEKALMNLVSNAAEAITETGEVTIGTANRHLDKPVRGYDEVKEGDYAVLIVSDTGMGIPAENMQKIFEPFYTKKKMGKSGTGLGLAIVWGTVKDHNGYIDIQSEVGHGTTFTLYFPVTREELTSPDAEVPIEQYMGHGESVLVVDDIADQREIASRLLSRLGYEVHAVSSGEEAVEYLGENRADILILDMVMKPGIDGLETYKRVLEINSKQKAILVSGFSETDRVGKAQKLGAGAYINKPYVLEKIGIAIRGELNR
ncbi:MAG: PAS domain S-box protein [Syntrophales bacterium]